MMRRFFPSFWAPNICNLLQTYMACLLHPYSTWKYRIEVNWKNFKIRRIPGWSLQNFLLMKPMCVAAHSEFLFDKPTENMANMCAPKTVRDAKNSDANVNIQKISLRNRLTWRWTEKRMTKRPRQWQDNVTINFNHRGNDWTKWTTTHTTEAQTVSRSRTLVNGAVPIEWLRFIPTTMYFSRSDF